MREKDGDREDRTGRDLREQERKRKKSCHLQPLIQLFPFLHPSKLALSEEKYGGKQTRDQWTTHLIL